MEKIGIGIKSMVNSVSNITNQDINELMNNAISLLSTHHDKAVELLHPYIPVNGPVTIDYGIYSLQYALIFGETIQKNPKKKSLPIIIGGMFEECKTKNFDEYIKLITWITEEISQVHEQMKRARVNLQIDSALYQSLGALAPFNPSEVQRLVLSLQIVNPTHHMLGNAYKDMYEVTFFLELLAHLILLPKGNKFTTHPFEGLVVNGNQIHDKKGRLIKGNAINWLEKNSYPELSAVVKASYNNQLRNLIGGHNDYRFDVSSKTYVSNDEKIKFKYLNVYSHFSALELLFSALRLDGLTRYYEDADLPIKIWEIGFTNWSFNEKKDKILITQNWSNFNQRDKSYTPKMISFYRLPSKREGKYVSLGFDGKYVFPYDLRVIANRKSLELMKYLLTKDKIDIVIASVAPKVNPFTKVSKTTVSVSGKEFLVVSDLEAEVEIDKPALETLIDYLEN